MLYIKKLVFNLSIWWQSVSAVMQAKPEAHCTISGCPRQKTGIVSKSRLFLDANLSSGTAKNHAVCLGLKTNIYSNPRFHKQGLSLVLD